MGYIRTRAGAVITVCGSRVYDLPGYYLDAVIRMNNARKRDKRLYDLAHAEKMRNLRAGRKRTDR